MSLTTKLIAQSIIPPFVFIALSGDWSWFEGWVSILPNVIAGGMCYTYLYHYDRALFNERMTIFSVPSADGWLHKALVFLALMHHIIIPLDSKRFGLSASIMASIPYLPLIRWIACMAMLSGVAIAALSHLQNTFLSPVLRIQKERGQIVISHGLYGMMRHPMYSGMLLQYGGMALFCGSVLGMTSWMALVIVIVLRTNAEETMLVEGLKGYDDYMKKVKYRFFPMVY